MVGFKVNVPWLRTSASVLAVILMTSGAGAGDGVTAGTVPLTERLLAERFQVAQVLRDDTTIGMARPPATLAVRRR
jgi:hypothetical protein